MKDKLSIKNAIASVIKALDKNGNGKIDIEDIISLAIKTPGVYIDRAKFLQNELYKNHTQDIINKAIATTPAQAGISSDEINSIAEEVINFERNSVSGISTVLGAPGGWAMLATISVDIVQYYAFTLRAIQKLLYLYGFPEINSNEGEVQLDSQTMNLIILCLLSIVVYVGKGQS